MNGRLIILEGNISAGKSTLAKSLGRILGCHVFMEPTVVNPYLSRFYADPKKWALKMQLWLLRQRYLTYVAAIRSIMDSGVGILLDRSVYSDIVFADKGHADGNISEAGYQYYMQLRNKMLDRLPVPHITIYLDASPQVCHQRIKMRSRDCESGIPLDYLEGLDRCYQNFLSLMKSKGSHVLRYDWQQFGDPAKIAQDVLRYKPPTLAEWCGEDVESMRRRLQHEESVRAAMHLDYSIAELDVASDEESAIEDDFDIEAENMIEFGAQQPLFEAAGTSAKTAAVAADDTACTTPTQAFPPLPGALHA